ncbi:PDZ and LIM domain protein 3 isoform X4 [Apis cerana]|uniref:PDZ and LIM domain protein 3 isoform X4 n=1 Tax=Apis cerana TaxID=7461 RepID=UPI002B22D2A9|nr:PDZ and LIM domain protein 3 isoform X4 [Apis cerana]XP_061936272.1 PDZ and LIM domain protein 3 isoform X4 [Apis cerana]XP_061936273.1 PDZ and LIM domain protein 3 isoform X4 [Apis cerana]XP_061936274.1 PDZ and LIM domain protein 3 isoform X4 [Apis cerana]
MTRKQTIIVKLKRSSTGKPWGIRIAGGADLGTPIVVTRSENETLQRGDVIKKIDDYDARDVRHVDAQNLLQNSESIRLVIERAKQRKLPSELPKSPVPPPSIDEYNRPTSSPDHLYLPHEHLDEVREERAYLSQPYRTTPLVLPGAKIKKDAPLGECYLRHHPNPMIRAAPHHYEPAHPEVAMKQKVAETVLQRVLGPNEVPKVVHKQFNSPIGLYSEENIADTIKCQASAIPPKKPMKYDPSKSEAYKALQEEALGDTVQEVKQPARTGVFSPQKVNQNRIYHARPKSPAGPYVNILDDDGEKIHQSNSFKRIMYSVLGQTDY